MLPAVAAGELAQREARGLAQQAIEDLALQQRRQHRRILGFVEQAQQPAPRIEQPGCDGGDAEALDGAVRRRGQSRDQRRHARHVEREADADIWPGWARLHDAARTGQVEGADEIRRLIVAQHLIADHDLLRSL